MFKIFFVWHLENYYQIVKSLKFLLVLENLFENEMTIQTMISPKTHVNLLQIVIIDEMVNEISNLMNNIE